MNSKKIILLTLIHFFVCLKGIKGQAIVEGNGVYYPYLHPVEYEQVVYKSAYQIDEIGLGILENLALRIYYPADLEPDEKRPLVVLIHGGGFIGGNFSSFFDEAEWLAQLGYVAVSVQYRLCKRNDCLIAGALTFPCNVSWGNSLVPSSYVAAVDVQDAINWLIDHSDIYPIDPDKIAVGGHSAGAFTALNVAYMDQEEANEICAGCGTWPDYLEGNLEDIPGIKSVFSLSGAMYDTTWIDPEETHIDLMAIHGTDDGVVYYGAEPVYPCCNTYGIPVFGACPLVQRQQNLGGDSYLLTGTGFGHDVFEPEWWPRIQEQVLWFLGKSLFGEAPIQKHVEMIRSSPVANCPAPLQPIVPAVLCGPELSEPFPVFFEFPNATTEVDLENNLRLYPNPASDILFIEFDFHKTDSEKGITFEVFNTLGQRVTRHEIFDIFGTLSWPVGHLESGLYWLKVNISEGHFGWKRFVVVQ
ncbi:MAG: alpha/beta fold hydrolase [Saprospiraceae bacterium]|nr:alpha/beta fold hydrolase [Saprospiraceae bacterium]MCB9326143.1 alpha/beta fold hydrolase [Lewinellaceae bacterium]